MSFCLQPQCDRAHLKAQHIRRLRADCSQEEDRSICSEQQSGCMCLEAFRPSSYSRADCIERPSKGDQVMRSVRARRLRTGDRHPSGLQRMECTPVGSCQPDRWDLPRRSMHIELLQHDFHCCIPVLLNCTYPALFTTSPSKLSFFLACETHK